MATILSDILEKKKKKKKRGEKRGGGEGGELEILYRFGDSLAVYKGGTFPYLLLPDLSV